MKKKQEPELIEIQGVVFCGKQAAVVKSLLDRIRESEHPRFYGGEPMDTKRIH